MKLGELIIGGIILTFLLTFIIFLASFAFEVYTHQCGWISTKDYSCYVDCTTFKCKQGTKGR